MGSSQSLLTREEAFELTHDTRNLMNVLLEYMLKEVTVRDFLALSNPSECKKYVLFMANNLYKHFYELQIVPTKDKKGIIAFRSIKDLVNPPEDNVKQSLCLTLAYFYTRIFQIYGALALTLIDDAKYMTESGIISLHGNNTTYGLVPPGYGPYTTMGGDISSSYLGNFNFLRSYLYYDRNTKKGYQTRYNGENSGMIFFNRQHQEKNKYGFPVNTENISEVVVQTGVFLIGYNGADRYAFLEVFAKLEGIGGETKFKFGRLKYNKINELELKSIELGTDILSNKTITIESHRDTPTSSYIYNIKGSSLSISEYFNKIFNKILPYLKNLVEGDKGVMVHTTTETGTADELKLGRIIQNLTKTKPLGHCLARALQLLKTMPLKDEPGVSFICKSKFLEQTTGTHTTISRSGLPEPGDSLDTSPGLSALSQLFYDTVLIGTPKIVISQESRINGQPSSLQQYVVFMKNMAKLFGDNDIQRSNSLAQVGLKGIKNKRDTKLCGSTTDNILLPPNATNDVYAIVNQLYKIQIDHASTCGKVFHALFNIQHDKSSGRSKISLSNNIIKKGFPEIERLNYLARNILIKYYSNCEETYIRGMKLVLDKRQ